MTTNNTRRALVLAISLGFAPLASAMYLNPQGTGQVLILPYYTVNAGNVSLLSVVNESQDIKAVKLRFLEGLNGRSVLDFNLYLSAFDVWTAVLVADGSEGPARLITSDTSCTVPALPAAGQPFHNLAYTGSSDDDGPNGLDRTREGHIELIEMGVVVDSNGAAFNAATSFADAATHFSGRPAGCARLVAAWNDGAWSRNPTFSADFSANGVTRPTGRLYGSAVIANVADGRTFAYTADAIEGFYTLAVTRLHTPPGSASPNLADAETAPGRVDATVFAPGQLINLQFVSGRPDAVSALFMAKSIDNEFNVQPELGAASEWVITFPTKRLHIEQMSPARRRPFTDNLDDTDGEGQILPVGVDAIDGLVFDPDGACELIGLFHRNREEGPEEPFPVIEDAEPRRPASICRETNVLSLNQVDSAVAQGTQLLGSRALVDQGEFPRNLLFDARERVTPAGSIRINFAAGDGTNFLLDGIENAGSAPRNQVFGLPVTGFWVARYLNSAARPGVLANYATLLKHRSTVEVRSVLVTGEGSADESIRRVASP